MVIITRRGMKVRERKFVLMANVDLDFPSYKDSHVCYLNGSSQQHRKGDH